MTVVVCLFVCFEWGEDSELAQKVKVYAVNNVDNLSLILGVSGTI